MSQYVIPSMLQYVTVHTSILKYVYVHITYVTIYVNVYIYKCKLCKT